MSLTRRSFHRGAAAIAAAALLPMPAHATAPPSDEALVLARATDVNLSAQETAVVLAPVPSRRSSQKLKRVKGAKPVAPRTWIVLRDVMATERTPAYDLFLVLEGPDVFRPTTTSQHVGALEVGGATGSGEAFAFDVTEALAKLSKVRGYHLRRLRLSIVRRPVADASGNATVPSDPTPPEIGAIELARW